MSKKKKEEKDKDDGTGPLKEEQRAAYLESMKDFWQKQLESIDQTDFKKIKHQLPLARIKKIMKSDEDVRMISAEAPVLFAKACELFVLDLTMRAWAHTDENKRRTLQRSDVADAIASSEMFDFLVDIVPRGDSHHEANTTDDMLRSFGARPLAKPANSGGLPMPVPGQFSSAGSHAHGAGESSSSARLVPVPVGVPAAASADQHSQVQLSADDRAQLDAQRQAGRQRARDHAEAEAESQSEHPHSIKRENGLSLPAIQMPGGVQESPFIGTPSALGTPLPQQDAFGGVASFNSDA